MSVFLSIICFTANFARFFRKERFCLLNSRSSRFILRNLSWTKLLCEPHFVIMLLYVSNAQNASTLWEKPTLLHPTLSDNLIFVSKLLRNANATKNLKNVCCLNGHWNFTANSNAKLQTEISLTHTNWNHKISSERFSYNLFLIQ